MPNVVSEVGEQKTYAQVEKKLVDDRAAEPVTRRVAKKKSPTNTGRRAGTVAATMTNPRSPQAGRAAAARS